MIRAIQHNCARSYEWTIAALKTGVERRADVVCLQEPPRGRKGFEIKHTAYEIRKRNRVWTAVGKGSGDAVDKRTDLSKGGNDDVIVTDIQRRGEKVIRIVNICDQKDTQSRERPARKQGCQLALATGLECRFGSGYWSELIRSQIGGPGRQ